MKRIITILSLVSLLLFAVGCKEKCPDGSTEVNGHCMGLFVPITSTPSISQWQDEFECDQWAPTGITLFKDDEIDCAEWRLYNGEWYMTYSDKSGVDWNSFPNKVFKQCSFYKNETACSLLDSLGNPTKIEKICRQIPYEEQECVHQKLVGRKIE